MGFDINKLVGLPEEEAEQLCQHYNYRMRVNCRDNQYMIVTADYRLDRVNVSITDGKVSFVKGIG